MELNKELELKWINALSKHITPNRWELIQKAVKERTRHITVVLEDIYQAHNAGALMRSCDAFGIQDLHFIQNRNQVDFSKTTVSKGARKWLDLHYYQNTHQCIEKLHQNGYNVVAMTLNSRSTQLEHIPLEKPIAIMIGNELEGLSQTACNNADYCIKLPMYGFTESFNLSVCGALAMHTLTNRIRQSNINWNLSEDAQRQLTLNYLQRCIAKWQEHCQP